VVLVHRHRGSRRDGVASKAGRRLSSFKLKKQRDQRLEAPTGGLPPSFSLHMQDGSAGVGVSAEERRQIDEAIRVSKELWLAGAPAEQRRRSRPAPARSAGADASACGCIDLCSSSDEEEAPAVPKAELAKRPLERPSDNVCVAVAPMAKRPAVAAHAAATGRDDRDVTVEGTRGAMSLIDFPHARENCGKHKFELGNFTVTCTNCFCYVCDIPASDCAAWAAHCSASHSEPRWRKERERQRLARSSASTAAPAPAAPTAVRVAATAPARARMDAAWSCDRVMREVQQVYPVEVAEPHSAGLLPTVRLRPYQKQSLAFMLDRERARDAAGAGTGANCAIRGGWLADEMGMGKTMVCISLILANPALVAQMDHDRPRKATLVLAPVSLLGQWLDEINHFAPNLRVAMLTTQSKGSGCGADVVLATHQALVSSVSLSIRQYRYHRIIVDEVHALPKSNSYTVSQINELTARTPNVWLVTGTPLMRGPDDLTTGNMLLGQRLPLSLGVGPELRDALRRLMIRHTKHQVIGGTAALTLPTAQVETVWLEMTADERALYEASKQDRSGAKQKAAINGVDARSLEINLTLQRNTCSNVYWRTHDPGRVWSIPDDIFRGHYNRLSRLANISHHDCRGIKQSTGMPLPILRCCTKLRALCEDVRALVRTEPDAHAVVFTHSRVAHFAVAQLMKQEGIATLEFSGSTTANKRHGAIRDFQAAVASGPEGIRGRGAKVFVITVKTGAVGITLTAASRVYLLEPALDPRTELQAAGRIHRLGQTKQVHIKRFAFRGTCEEEIIGLHNELEMGHLEVVDGKLPPAAVQRILRQ
jgi:superfamily II DNA or RNA helicase